MHPPNTSVTHTTVDSNEQKKLLKDPDIYLSYRKALENTFNARYSYIINGSKTSTEVKNMVISYMRSTLSSHPTLL
jgi:hypothetical protein